MRPRFTFLLAFVVNCFADRSHLLGVNPTDVAFFTSVPFACRDGSQTFETNVVNDNYCDCSDGSDEPGTSACPNGQFFCMNKGFVPKIIFSSRVDDRICDCCDGSDESNAGICENTCAEAQFKASAHLRQELEAAKMGVEAKKVQLTACAETFSSKENELVAAKKELEELLVVLEEKEKIKNEKEEKEKAEKDRLKEEQVNDSLDSETTEQPEEGEAPEDSGDDTEGELPPEELDEPEAEQEAFPYPKEYAFRDDAELEEKERISAERFELLQFLSPHIDDAIYKNSDGSWHHERVASVFKYKIDREMEQLPLTEDAYKNYQQDGVWDAKKSMQYIKFQKEKAAYFERKKAEEDEDFLEDDDEVELDTDEDEPVMWHSYVDPEAKEARDDYNEVNRQKYDLERKVKELEEFLAADFGPDKEFIAMATQCFDIKDGKYTYEFCPFESASQKEGASSTNLGKFEKWKENSTDRVMMFTKGQSCWQGPQRSLEVTFKCGNMNKVLSVSEPSKCTYVMDFQTPTVCSEERIEDLEKAIAAMIEVGNGDS